MPTCDEPVSAGAPAPSASASPTPSSAEEDAVVFRASERDAGLLVRAEVLSAVSPVFRAFLALGHEPLPRVITTHCPRESNAAFLELVSTLAFETRPSDQPPTPARLTLRLLQLGADAMPLLFKYDVRGVVKTLKTVMADELVCNFTHWVATQTRFQLVDALLALWKADAQQPCCTDWVGDNEQAIDALASAGRWLEVTSSAKAECFWAGLPADLARSIAKRYARLAVASHARGRP
ncbi:hypothetical protein KFE25_010567 [Diacronema lutheri]|uniref:BTB domain-containing protein n=1 Tax=Diacronema lutheri TaxID=2081491 RepID=A0A8J5XLW3_DIALT|nr:hypothetical protein KFE25_010567 [Diacronema lutheri]